MQPIISLQHIHKAYSVNEPILHDICLSLYKSEYCALIGPSGCGKSTLLHIMALLDTADAGTIYYKGNVINLHHKDINIYRNQEIGMIFQHHHLMAELTIYDNITLPAKLAPKHSNIDTQYIHNLCEKAQISHLLHKYPHQLSGGEKQRASIIRALVNKPSLLLADEPTGNLDPETATQIFTLLQELITEYEMASLIITHDWNRQPLFDKTYMMQHKNITLAV